MAQLAEPGSCAHFTAQVCCSPELKNPTGRREQDPNGTKPPHNKDPAQSLEMDSCPDSRHHHNHHSATCPDQSNNSFITLNLNPILCSKKQHRTPPEASATSQNSPLASQTSSTPLELPASVQSVCKACHESKQSLFHKLGPCTAAQCQAHRKGCPPAFLSSNSSDVHTAMGNSRGIQLLGWFSYIFLFSLADAFEL